MRTTIDIEDDLYRMAKSRAALQGIRLRELFERALRRELSQPQEDQAEGHRAEEPIFKRKTSEVLVLDVMRAAEEQAIYEEDVAKSGLDRR